MWRRPCAHGLDCLDLRRCGNSVIKQRARQPPAIAGALKERVPTMHRMLNSLNTLLMPAALERLTLVVNHVLASEPVATGRLRPHAGRCIAFQLRNWPS